MDEMMQRIQSYLESDEPEYEEAALQIGEAGVPYLLRIVQESNPELAARAAEMAGLIPSPLSLRVLEAAVERGDPEVRSAAAYALGHFNPPLETMGVKSLADEPPLNEMLGTLLQDQDPSVRKFALKSAAQVGARGVRPTVQQLADDDPEPFIRDLAQQTLSGLSE
jgi:HEAT repeat protein